MTQTEKNLRALCSVNGVAGFEYQAAEKVAAIFRESCDEVKIDRFFNVTGFIKGSGVNPKTVLVTAHYDEIGLVVTGIEDSGFLRFTRTGGIDPKTLVAQEVTVHGKEDLFGVIGAKPPHLTTAEEMKKAVPMTDMRIDIGLSGDAAKEKVRVGDPVSIRVPMVNLKNGRMAGKTLDNKAGVAALLEISAELKRMHHEHHVILAATVQEELGVRGVISAAWHNKPDLGIVIDVGHGDMPDAPSDESFPLGKGVAVAVGPVLNREHGKAIIKLAKDEKIPVQIDPEADDTGTEASAMAVTREGIPTILLSIPLKYMHTPVELVSLDDIVATGKLAARYIAYGMTSNERSARSSDKAETNG